LIVVSIIIVLPVIVILAINPAERQAGEIEAGDLLLNQNGDYVEVLQIKRVYQPIDVYNLSIDQTHVFIANGLVVSNEAKPYGPY